MMNLIAKGNTAEIFDYAEGSICKLFNAGYPVESVRNEFYNAKLLYDLKLPVPKCYEQIVLNDRHGLIYERVNGADLSTYLMDISKYRMVLSTLVNMQKTLHDYESDLLPSYKDFVRGTIGDTDKDLISLLDELPDGNTLCHGDLHPGNIMIDGNGEVKVIDFINLCRGPKEYDIARTYYLLAYSRLPEDMSNKEDLAAMRERFANDYLDEMGLDIQDIRLYLALVKRCHIIETAHNS